MNKTTICLVVLVAALMSACVGITPTSDTVPGSTPLIGGQVSNGGCIAPITTFAYPQVSVGDFPPSEMSILPATPWMVESEFPSELDTNGIDLDSVYVEVQLIRPLTDHEEIWIMVRDLDRYTTRFITYRTDQQEWNIIAEGTGEDEASPARVFLARDDSVWGIGISGNEQGFPLFSKYDETSQRFLFASDTENILQAFGDASRYVSPLVDSEGVFWFVYSNALFSFDPKTRIAEKHHEDSTPDYDLAPRPVFGVDGSIFLLRLGQKNIIQFFPNTGEFRDIPIALAGIPRSLDTPDLYDVYDIFSDNAGRVWVHDYGWRDPDGIWYQVIRSPIFISDHASDRLRYTRDLPSIVLESSDGRLWFSSGNGLAWLEPAIGEWCWFTTTRTNIVEDLQGDIWLVSNGTLYRLPLDP